MSGTGKLLTHGWRRSWGEERYPVENAKPIERSVLRLPRLAIVLGLMVCGMPVLRVAGAKPAPNILVLIADDLEAGVMWAIPVRRSAHPTWISWPLRVCGWNTIMYIPLVLLPGRVC
jgi:hypothetical protein